MHFESAKQLKMNKDVVLTRPDKGAGVVILNKDDYLPSPTVNANGVFANYFVSIFLNLIKYIYIYT